MPSLITPITFNILLADDDIDDRFFFNKALNSLPFQFNLSTVIDGERLMTYLFENINALPDVLYLDYNMPRKNGVECLGEIKSDPLLRHLPVIIYSTYLDETMADKLYAMGAHYYVRKSDLAELKLILQFVLTQLAEKKFVRPPIKQFILSIREP
jgi:CheY-like chemotaxis protein